ncbi:MAG: chemotaxis protein CheW [Vampirovibrionales bacterium]|nr:chemotaxis protein CheW [Vampirovibrionales bacterium]
MSPNSTQNIATFTLGNDLFGVDIRYVREINRQLDLTPVPHAPAFVEGLLNLRGQIVTVLDLKKRLGVGKTQLGDHTHNVILKTEGEFSEIRTRSDGDTLDERPLMNDLTSLLVDDIADVVTIDANAVEPAPANLELIDRRYIAGIVKLDKRLLTVLNVHALQHGLN